MAFRLRGSVYRAKGDTNQAIADFTEEIRLEPRFANAFVSRGMVYLGQEQFDRAISDYNEAIRLDPNEAVAFLNRGTAYHRIRQYDRAIADFTSVLSMQPQGQLTASALSKRCQTRSVVGRDLQGTLDDCTNALKLLPNDNWSLSSRGYTYLRLGELDRSIADFDASLTIDSKVAVPLYGRSLARRRAGDSLAADKDFAAARAIWPGVAKMVATEYGLQ